MRNTGVQIVWKTMLVISLKIEYTDTHWTISRFADRLCVCVCLWCWIKSLHDSKQNEQLLSFFVSSHFEFDAIQSVDAVFSLASLSIPSLTNCPRKSMSNPSNKTKNFFFLSFIFLFEKTYTFLVPWTTRNMEPQICIFSPVRYFVLHWMLFLCAVVIFWYFNIFFSLLRSIVLKESDDSSFCNIRGMPVERAKNSNSFVRCFFFLLSSASRSAGNFIPYF